MPVYEYLCRENGQSVEVTHSMKEKLKTWGEVCAALEIEPGETPLESPVERLIQPVLISSPTSNTDLKGMGFTKLVKRDEGVYENVTASGGEKKYMTRGDASSLPHIHKKISD